MKTIIFILLLFPFFCFAQKEKSKTNAPIKPSASDCPRWNKKDKQKDKATYFQFLRSNKTMVNQQATDNSASYRDSKIQPNPIPEKTENSNEKRKVTQTNEKRNTEKTTVLETKKQKKTTTTSALSEEKKVNKIDSDVSETDDKKTEKPDNGKIKKKAERLSKKTTKVNKRSNAKCPSF